MATLNIYLLGSPRLDLDGEAVPLERNKALALLAYLAMEDGGQARETLATLLWPEYDHERAYAYLRRTLWEINERLGEGWLAAGRVRVALPRLPGLRLDVNYFRETLEECAGHGHPVDQVCWALRSATRTGGGVLPGGFHGWLQPARQCGFR